MTIDEFLKITDPVRLQSYLRNNFDEIAGWSRRNLDRANEHIDALRQEAGSGGAGFAEAQSILAAIDSVEGSGYEAALDQASIAAQEAILAKPGQAPDLSAIQNLAPENLSPTEVAEFVQRAGDSGREGAQEEAARQLQSQGVDEATANQQAEDQFSGRLSTTPEWILQATGGELSDDQKSRMLEYWNDLYGTRFTDFDNDLVPHLSDPSQAKQLIVDAALADSEPTISYKVEIPGRDIEPVLISQQAIEILRNDYGLDTNAVTRAVRLAGLFGADNGTGDIAWQPMLALARALGIDDNLGEQEQYTQDLDRFNQSRRQEGAGFSFFRDGRQPTRQGNPLSGAPRNPEQDAYNGVVSTPGFDVMDFARVPGTSTASYNQVMSRFQEGMERYGNGSLAYLHALDAGLASRIAASGGDPTKIAPADNQRAQQFMLKGGWSNQNMAALGYATGDDSIIDMIGFYQQWALDELAKEEGPVRQLPDPVAVADAMKTLWQQLFRTQPSEATIAAFQKDLEAQVASAPPEQSIDITARIRQFAQGQPVYRDLYGKKQGGATDEEYQGQFLAASRSLLGNELPDEGSIVQGMKSGQYQTTVGSTAASAKAWQNSVFLERLTQAANLVSQET